MRGCCLHQSVDEHRVKKQPFAFAIVYIKCFRTYSVYLSFWHGVLILYTPCHLPPQREARALPRRAPKSTASAIRSRTCGRQRLAFLAVSATGGARKPNPSEGAENRFANARRKSYTGEPSSLTAAAVRNRGAATIRLISFSSFCICRSADHFSPVRRRLFCRRACR